MSPAYPAAWLLFCMVFAMEAVYFLSLPWSGSATAAIYSIPILWCLLVLRDRAGKEEARHG